MGLAVTFTDTSTPAADIIAWVWDFGDGTQDTVQNPVHTYAIAGTYNVTLYVFGAFGGIDHVTHPVTVTVGDWVKVFDFTLNDGSFVNDVGGASVWVTAYGWSHTTGSANLRISRSFTAVAADIYYVDYAYTIVADTIQTSRLIQVSVPPAGPNPSISSPTNVLGPGSAVFGGTLGFNANPANKIHLEAIRSGIHSPLNIVITSCTVKGHGVYPF